MQWCVSNLLNELNCYNRDTVLDMLSYLNYSIANWVGRLDQFINFSRFPIFRNDTNLGLFVIGIHRGRPFQFW